MGENQTLVDHISYNIIVFDAREGRKYKCITNLTSFDLFDVWE